jgi:hypothetical protein
VEVEIDGKVHTATGCSSWTASYDATQLSPGDYDITVRAVDKYGLETNRKITIALNKSDHQWKPKINDLYHIPQEPTNEDNVVIYANTSAGGPYDISKVTLYWTDEIATLHKDMFRYADNPSQNRSSEDPLANNNNEPIFGIELGQFPTAKKISYWVTIIDTANNSITSNIRYFQIK